MPETLNQDAIRQQKLENFVTLGSVVLGGNIGYEFGSRMFEGKSPMGKVLEYGLKVGSIVVGSTVGLVAATYGLIAKQEADSFISRTK